MSRASPCISAHGCPSLPGPGRCSSRARSGTWLPAQGSSSTTAASTRSRASASAGSSTRRATRIVGQMVTAGDGRKLAYERLGSGPALVCHGGGPGFSGLYLQNLGGLDEHLELIVLDPRGTGGSDRPADSRAYTVEDYANDVEELRAHLGLERISLLGHSHGGVVAMEYAARHPERVDRLILASTLVRFAAEQQRALEAGMAARRGEPLYAAAAAALEAEEAGDFGSDEGLAEVVYPGRP